MVPLGIERILGWMAAEHACSGSIFGIPEQAFYRGDSAGRASSTTILGEPCELPLGPAAGPHTQLAQNIVAAWLCGARYLELKTVQKLDHLEIAKPCIDARDEGYNTEWSQELSLEDAFSEYLTAWAALHALQGRLGGATQPATGTVFAMSVGYDLEGIRSERVDCFIDRMIDARADSWSARLYERCLSALSRGPWPSAPLGFRISSSVTLSTMHGCPAREIEEICAHLMERKRLATLVKLNPTLVGRRDALALLRGLGWADISPLDSAFDKDLRFADAVAMIERLSALARREGVGFGVKLSNTLGVANDGRVLPGEERYLSGRPLAPLTLLAALRLAEALGPGLVVSYSGGASALNLRELLATGMRPVTVATDLLKPGGYLRLRGMADIAEQAVAAGLPPGLDVPALRHLAGEARAGGIYRRLWRAPGAARVEGSLPLADCVAAPCVSGCPIGQRVPDYIRLLGEGRPADALQMIRCHNALPGITGWICDHPCMERCSRIDYEGPVLIRELKRIAVGRGGAPKGCIPRAVPGTAGAGKVAVIGAGPSGLATAFFLARSGVAVTVFDKQPRAGGVVTSVLPSFRMPSAVPEADISYLVGLGVEMRLGVEAGFSIPELSARGFTHVYVATGAEVARTLALEGAGPIPSALALLRAYNSARGAGGPEPVGRAALGIGRRVAVVGGGNTAMDGARTAKRLRGVERVAIIYRRSEEEMPADREELEAAREEGVELLTLLAPEAFDGRLLRCRRMGLGAPGPDGRRVPVRGDETVELEMDSVISAIGETADAALLRSAGLVVGDGDLLVVDPRTMESSVPGVFAGGDAVRGGSTVVRCMADARRAAEEILRRLGIPWPEEPPPASGARPSAAAGRRLPMPAAPGSGDDELVRVESHRCLQCDLACDRCVEVCPNRANVAIPVAGLRDATQILHLDSLCNDCGACATFCLYDARPYRDKLTLFMTPEAFEASRSPGFLVDSGGRLARLRVGGREIDPEGPEGADGEVRATREMVRAVLRSHAYLFARSSS